MAGYLRIVVETAVLVAMQVREGCGLDRFSSTATAWPGLKFAKPDAACGGTEAFALSGDNN